MEWRGRTQHLVLDWAAILAGGHYDPRHEAGYHGAIPGATLTRPVSTRAHMRTAPPDQRAAAVARAMEENATPAGQLQYALSTLVNQQRDNSIEVSSAPCVQKIGVQMLFKSSGPAVGPAAGNFER